MGSPLDIVLIGTVQWQVVHSVAEYTTTELARENRVLFVEPFNSLPAMIREARWQKRQRKTGSGITQINERLWVYSPPAMGVAGANRWDWALGINGRLFACLIRKAYKSLGFVDPILWTYLYNSAPTFRHLPGRLKIYECGDEDCALASSEKQRQRVIARDRDLCREVDMIFAVTEELCAPRRPMNPATFEVNCAADPTFFTQKTDDGGEIPQDMRNIKGPIIGYLGSLDPWKMDVELLTHIAKARPDWNIVMVGYVWFGFDPAPLKALPNIHVLGSKPYDDLPKYVRAMDVCMMPFPLNEITRNGDALKCYEYLSAGKPVVSTPVPVARRLSNVVRVASTPDEFVAAIQSCLNEPSSAADERIRVAKQHTWAHRVQQKQGLIRNQLESSDQNGHQR